jgi:YVTN family beta-propeller protein
VGHREGVLLSATIVRLDIVISRRALLALPLATACSRRQPASRGYAFIANQEGGAVAVVDLEVMAVARHIPLAGAPVQVLAAQTRPLIYALTPENGTVHEIDLATLRFTRKVTAGSQAIEMLLAPDEKFLYVLMRDPKALVCVSLDGLKVVWRLLLADEPVTASLASDGKSAVLSSIVLSSGGAIRLVDLGARTLSQPLAQGDIGEVRFLKGDKTFLAADRGERRLSLYDVASLRLIAHLPLAVRPDQLCFNSDLGQLFITGAGMDAVVVVYPFYTPEVAETVLAGHAPGAMAASERLLFVASPLSGDVSILNVATRKVIAVVQVGTDPGFVTVTPDDQFALVLNRTSGDVAVLSVPSIESNRNRYKSASFLTMIPVGSRPVSAAVRVV